MKFNPGPSFILVFAAFAFSISGCGKSLPENISCDQVENFSLQRFEGNWYEIARLPHREEKNLEMVTLLVEPPPEGKKEHQVTHRSFNTDTWKWQEKTGRIWQPDTLSSSSCLRISYVLFFGGDFQVIDMDKENYQWVFVKSDDLQTIWILGRNNKLPLETLQAIAQRGTDWGFPMNKLKRVYHNMKQLEKK